LHPDLLPALARLILAAAKSTQIIVVSHAPQLVEELETAAVCTHLHLLKEFGETKLDGSTLFNSPKWNWPCDSSIELTVTIVSVAAPFQPGGRIRALCASKSGSDTLFVEGSDVAGMWF
jgi:hypothetical protein